LDEACEDERLPNEDELLMERVEADNSFNWDSRVATLRMESFTQQIFILLFGGKNRYDFQKNN
jgi:hypothetical protein